MTTPSCRIRTMLTKCFEHFRPTKTTRLPCHPADPIGQRTSSRCSLNGRRTDTSRKPLWLLKKFPYPEAGMNSKAAQLRENGTEIVRLFARFALGASFLSAVADRFGLWGPYGAKNVSWGNFARFVEYTGAVTSLFPSSSTVSFAWAATVAETLFGILLIAGFKIRMASVLSGLLLLSFAIGMATGLGIKTPFDYSVFSAAAAAFLLAFWEPDRFTLDRLLNITKLSARTR